MDKLSLENFDWGWMSKDSDEVYIYPDGSIISSAKFHREQIIQEIFKDAIYEKFFEVADNDIVLDIGASHGPFTYSILHKKPKHVYCIEPSKIEFPFLVKNTRGYPVTQINKGISKEINLVYNDQVFGTDKLMEGISFSKLLELFSLEKIDFMKTDCEGGEYDIFTLENLNFLKNCVRKISGEWHLHTIEEKSKFRFFRDNILINFKNFEVYSVDGINIKWDVWNEHFIEYYNQVIFYIKN